MKRSRDSPIKHCHDERRRLRSALGHVDRNLSVPEASVLRVLLDQPNQRGTHAMFTDPKEQDAVAELLRVETLVEYGDTLAIHDDVAFSLLHRYRPPRSVVSSR